MLYKMLLTTLVAAISIGCAASPTDLFVTYRKIYVTYGLLYVEETRYICVTN